MKKYIGLVFFAFLFSNLAFAQANEKLTISPHLGLGKLSWKEDATIGNFGFELRLKPKKSKLSYNLELNALSSFVDSKGNANQDNFGNSTSLGSGSNTVIYRGGEAKIQVGVPLKLKESFAIEPFLGIENQTWARQIQNNDNPKHSYNIYEERYKFLSPELGAKLFFGSKKTNYKVVLKTTVAYPIIANQQETVRTRGENSVMTNPLKKQIIPTFELKTKYKNYNLTFKYELMYIQSNDSSKVLNLGSQTKATLIGITFGYDF